MNRWANRKVRVLVDDDYLIKYNNLRKGDEVKFIRFDWPRCGVIVLATDHWSNLKGRTHELYLRWDEYEFTTTHKSK